MRSTRLWMGWLGLLISTVAWGTQYRYPSELPVKSLKLEVARGVAMTVGEVTHVKKVRVEEPAKQLKDTRPLSAVTLHVCQANGTDLSFKPSVRSSSSWTGGGWAIKSFSTVILSWTPIVPNVAVDDVYPCYISFEEGEKKWVSREFSLKIGGSGKHLHCNQCFSIGNAPKTTLTAATSARMMALSGGTNATLARGSMVRAGATRRESTGTEGPVGSVSSIRVQDIMDGDDIQGHDVELGEDIFIYSIDVLPKKEPMGQVKAGLTVKVIEEIAPSLVHVKFTTSSGRTYEGAAKMSDLVPQYEVGVEISGSDISNSMPSGPHQNIWEITHIPKRLFATGPEGSVEHLCCIKQDETVQHVYRNARTVSPSSEYGSLRGILKLEARPGDEFLCYAMGNDGKQSWVSQPFGLVCGEGKHHMCAGCFELAPPETLEAMMKRALVAKRAKWASNRSPMGNSGQSGMGATPSSAVGFRLGKVALRHDTPIYSLKSLPQEQVLGTLRAGAELYVMEDMGGEFVRVRFMTPAGRSGEGAAKKSDIGPTAR